MIFRKYILLTLTLINASSFVEAFVFINNASGIKSLKWSEGKLSSTIEPSSKEYKNGVGLVGVHPKKWEALFSKAVKRFEHRDIAPCNSLFLKIISVKPNLLTNTYEGPLYKRNEAQELAVIDNGWGLMIDTKKNDKGKKELTVKLLDPRNPEDLAILKQYPNIQSQPNNS